ncbi:MAG: Cys-tRNA(Pro) deacylase [Spirochaetales bacterium]|uniref:Cys-tRNA(Pro)/Cys-tRNA(Cys) deacylase n=1 Tax=Candidatus Thalassospirochaeta sargassi TaxID=3119039 RepID=A0AAJ1IHG3_9SPIO|nr:Cys-tRNA(Pro) deacylase [Spirochaetales bacterium]
MSKTNAVRLLESRKILFELKEYEVDESDLSAASVAAKTGLDADQIFKTLVLRGQSGELFVCVIPGPCELDLKKAAKAGGFKKVELIHVKEILPLTGYIRGGCSPIGMKKHYPTFVDETCLLFETIYVSAGVRGLQLQIAPGTLLEAAEAETADLI